MSTWHYPTIQKFPCGWSLMLTLPSQFPWNSVLYGHQRMHPERPWLESKLCLLLCSPRKLHSLCASSIKMRPIGWGCSVVQCPLCTHKDLVLIPSKKKKIKEERALTCCGSLWFVWTCPLGKKKNTLWSVDTIYHMIYGGLGIDFMAGGFIW